MASEPGYRNKCIHALQTCKEEFLYFYILNNVIIVLQCDLLIVQTLAKYNDVHRYILSVIGLF
jgi:hypothetical protein